MAGIKDLVDRIKAARDTVDGPEVRGQQIAITREELDGIYEAFNRPRPWYERALSRSLRAQLNTVSGGLSMGLGGLLLDSDSNSDVQVDVAQMKALLETLEESQKANPPLTSEQRYARFVSKIEATLGDG